ATGSHGISRPGATSAASHGTMRAPMRREMSGSRGAHGATRPGSGHVSARPRTLPNSTTRRLTRATLNATSGYTVTGATPAGSRACVGGWWEPCDPRRRHSPLARAKIPEIKHSLTTFWHWEIASSIRGWPAMEQTLEHRIRQRAYE